jgi:arginyl-tRNA synthetase
MLDLDDALVRAVCEALAAEGIEPGDRVRVERPADSAHGDRATNIAMLTAKAAGRAPKELAESLRARLEARPPPYVASVEVAGPGFLNFRLDDAWLHEILRAAATEGEADFARPRFGEGERVQVEFVSANPTGPVHVGNGWWASYGDAVARLLERCGYAVQREYYINDTGGQVRRLGASVLARRIGQPVPEDGYPSGFVKGLAAAYEGPDDAMEAGRWAAERTLRFIKMQMSKVNITFDSWYSQAAIEESEAVAGTVAFLAERGLVFEEDGALWLRTGEFGDPREKRVLRKSNGDYTYLAGDLAYHHDKFLVRGFNRVIDIWGADHQGQVASLAAGVAALGVDPRRLEIRLGQMISLTSGRMSKRAGNAVDLDDVVDDIGPDVMRLLSLQNSIDQGTTVDLDKVRAESGESPVYYVQMAYARIAGIGREAERRDIQRVPLHKVDLALLAHERELELLRSLSELEDVIARACLDRAPHRLAGWVREFADHFHGFYHDCYVIHPDNTPQLTQSRLWLVEAARVGLVISLGLLGVAAPDTM